MRQVFDLLYYVPGLTDIGLDDTDRKDRLHHYELLKARKDEERKAATAAMKPTK